MGYDDPGPHEPYYDTHAPETKDVHFDVETVYGLGKVMRTENSENLIPSLKSVRDNFKMDENNLRSADYPAARGIANISPHAKAALDAQDWGMWSAGWAMQSHSDGHRALGNIAMKISSEFTDTDELNGADIDKIREVTGIYPPTDGNAHPH